MAGRRFSVDSVCLANTPRKEEARAGLIPESDWTEKEKRMAGPLQATHIANTHLKLRLRKYRSEVEIWQREADLLNKVVAKSTGILIKELRDIKGWINEAWEIGPMEQALFDRIDKAIAKVEGK
jgi:hypothetical protein